MKKRVHVGLNKHLGFVEVIKADKDETLTWIGVIECRMSTLKSLKYSRRAIRRARHGALSGVPAILNYSGVFHRWNCPISRSVSHYNLSFLLLANFSECWGPGHEQYIPTTLPRIGIADLLWRQTTGNYFFRPALFTPFFERVLHRRDSSSIYPC